MTTNPATMSPMLSQPARPIHLYDLSRAQLRELLAEWGHSDYYAGLVWAGLYRDLAADNEEIEGLRPELHARLAAETQSQPLTVQAAIDSADGHTRKYLLGLRDGQAIETVLMDFRGRATACVSTQAVSYTHLFHSILFLNSQLPTAGSDVDAAPLADGAWQTIRCQYGLECLDGRGLRRPAVVAVGGIEGDEVDVGRQPLQQPAQRVGLLRPIVLPVDELSLIHI